MVVTFFFQHVVHVLEKLHVPSLVRSDGNGLHIFLDGGIHNFVYRAIVPEMNYLGTG